MFAMFLSCLPSFVFRHLHNGRYLRLCKFVNHCIIKSYLDIFLHRIGVEGSKFGVRGSREPGGCDMKLPSLSTPKKPRKFSVIYYSPLSTLQNFRKKSVIYQSDLGRDKKTYGFVAWSEGFSQGLIGKTCVNVAE